MFDILSSKYREVLCDFNKENTKYSAVNSFIGLNRHSDYFSELFILAENLSVLKRLDSNIFQKLNSLRNLKNTIQSNNEHIIKAALDIRFPYFIINCLHDDDSKIRCEVLDIFYELSKGCIENSIPLLPDIYNQSKNFMSIMNYLIISENSSKDISLNKSLSGDKFIFKELKGLATCFESPIYIIPIVRSIKIKNETSDNKEISIKILVNCLQGNERCQQALLSPMTDTLSTICMSLVAFSKSTDAALLITLKNLVESFLSTASPYMLKAFRLAPGSDILLKEQNLKIPDVVTLIIIDESIPEEISFEDNYNSLLHNLRNYLIGVYRKGQTEQKAVKHIIHKSIYYLQNLINLLWSVLEILPSAENKIIQISSEQRKQAKNKVKEIFRFLEWMLYNDYDFEWFDNIDNIE